MPRGWKEEKELFIARFATCRAYLHYTRLYGACFLYPSIYLPLYPSAFFSVCLPIRGFDLLS